MSHSRAWHGKARSNGPREADTVIVRSLVLGVRDRKRRVCYESYRATEGGKVSGRAKQLQCLCPSALRAAAIRPCSACTITHKSSPTQGRRLDCEHTKAEYVHIALTTYELSRILMSRCRVDQRRRHHVVL